MALVSCRECRAQVSSEAPTCPRCGVPGPAGVPAPVPLHGLDPETHRWVFEQLTSGVPREPVAQQLVRSHGYSGKGARAVVKRVETQALEALSPGASTRRGTGGNVAAAALSLWIPGLGQLTQGRPGRGLAMFGGAALLWIVLLGWTVHIAAAVEAARWDPAHEV